MIGKAGPEKLRQETCDICRRILGPKYASTFDSMGNLALSLDDTGHSYSGHGAITSYDEVIPPEPELLRRQQGEPRK